MNIMTNAAPSTSKAPVPSKHRLLQDYSRHRAPIAPGDDHRFTDRKNQRRLNRRAFNRRVNSDRSLLKPFRAERRRSAFGSSTASKQKRRHSNASLEKSLGSEQCPPPKVGSIDFYRIRLGLNMIQSRDSRRLEGYQSDHEAEKETEEGSRLQFSLRKKLGVVPGLSPSSLKKRCSSGLVHIPRKTNSSIETSDTMPKLPNRLASIRQMDCQDNSGHSSHRSRRSLCKMIAAKQKEDAAAVSPASTSRKRRQLPSRLKSATFHCLPKHANKPVEDDTSSHLPPALQSSPVISVPWDDNHHHDSISECSFTMSSDDGEDDSETSGGTSRSLKSLQSERTTESSSYEAASHASWRNRRTNPKSSRRHTSISMQLYTSTSLLGNASYSNNIKYLAKNTSRRSFQSSSKPPQLMFPTKIRRLAPSQA